MNAQRSVFDDAAYAGALRAANLVTASTNALVEFGHDLDAAALPEITRELGKVAELHRIVASRLAGVVRQLSEHRGGES